MSYAPHRWFWLAQDGRVYAGDRQAVVTESDPGYTAWIGSGGKPTPWPRDDDGEQTVAAMQEVVAPYGMNVPAPE